MRKKKTNKRIWLLTVLTVLLTIPACKEIVPEPEEKTANDYIYEKFIDWYLWYDQIPEIDPNGIESGEALVDSIRNPIDPWSFVTSYTTLQSWYQKGEYTGFGAGFVFDSERDIRISHVYTNSSFGKAGIERGWKVLTVNGYSSEELEKINEALSSNGDVTFEMEDLNHQFHQFVLKKGAISVNSVLHTSIHAVGSQRIGYMVFDSFINTSADELVAVADTFNRQNITDLIIDLRYNGGGLNTIANQLVGMIGGERVKGKVISMSEHNNKHTGQNDPSVSDYTGTCFNVSSVCFITTQRTASASELVINSLEPYINPVLIGDNTHGKPVGMYIFKVEKFDLAIIPISFKTVNSLGYGDYFNGLPADIYQSDDLTRNWGDPEEQMLKTALGYLTAPLATIAEQREKSRDITGYKTWPYTGFNQIVGAW